MRPISFLVRFRYMMAVAVMATGLYGCADVAELAGYNTATLNEEAAKNYMQVVNVAKSQNTIDSTSPTAKRVRAVFNRMVPYANQSNKTGIPFNWQLNVIRSNELNAWAMPGGKMVVYTGIVNQLKLTDDEIAAIMGHEMTHSLEEHQKKAAGQKILTNAALTVGGSLIKQSGAKISDNSLNMAKDILSTYGIGLPFSRQQESAADVGGLRLMAEAGYDPNAAITLWNKMNDVQDNNGLLNKITSDHPTNNDRINTIKKLLPQMMPIYEQSLQNKVASTTYQTNKPAKRKGKTKKK